MSRASKLTLKIQQILHLPRKTHRILEAHHILNVIFNSWSKYNHLPSSPNIAPTTKNSKLKNSTATP